MGLFSKLRAEFIDIIEWTDISGDTLVYRFERHNNEIKNNAKLTVREGQVAVFINEGKLADVFQPGMYTLNTENLPILSTLKGWKYGFNSPFKAEVYFVSTRNFTNQKWGTKNPITLSDDRCGMIELRAFGTFVIRVSDAAAFIREIVGTDGHFTADEITGQLRSIIVTRFTDAVGEANIPVEKYAANANEISELIHESIKGEFDAYGIQLTKFLVENISMPEEVKKEIFELSRLDRIDIDKLQRLKTAKAIEDAAKNESGTAGAGIGMGMGFAMANKMGEAMTQSGASNQNQAVPPPLPKTSAYFVVVNNQQTGPFDLNALKSKVESGEVLRDSLVWKEGMSAWEQAQKVDEISGFFGAVPPPIP